MAIKVVAHPLKNQNILGVVLGFLNEIDIVRALQVCTVFRSIVIAKTVPIANEFMLTDNSSLTQRELRIFQQKFSKSDQSGGELSHLELLKSLKEKCEKQIKEIIQILHFGGAEHFQRQLEYYWSKIEMLSSEYRTETASNHPPLIRLLNFLDDYSLLLATEFPTNKKFDSFSLESRPYTHGGGYRRQKKHTYLEVLSNFLARENTVRRFKQIFSNQRDLPISTLFLSVRLSQKTFSQSVWGEMPDPNRSFKTKDDLLFSTIEGGILLDECYYPQKREDAIKKARSYLIPLGIHLPYDAGLCLAWLNNEENSALVNQALLKRGSLLASDLPDLNRANSTIKRWPALRLLDEQLKAILKIAPPIAPQEPSTENIRPGRVPTEEKKRSSHSGSWNEEMVTVGQTARPLATTEPPQRTTQYKHIEERLGLAESLARDCLPPSCAEPFCRWGNAIARDLSDAKREKPLAPYELLLSKEDSHFMDSYSHVPFFLWFRENISIPYILPSHIFAPVQLLLRLFSIDCPFSVNPWTAIFPLIISSILSLPIILINTLITCIVEPVVLFFRYLFSYDSMVSIREPKAVSPQ